MDQLQERLYPTGNKAGVRLFQRIRNLATARKFDDSFLESIVEYHKMYPLSVNFDIFYAQYAIFHKAYQVAREVLEKAYTRRKVNVIIWELLIKCYEAFNDKRSLIFFMGLCSRLYAKPLKIDLPRTQLAEYLGLLSLSLGEANYAPFASHYMVLTENGTEKRPSVFAGDRCIPCFSPTDRLPYWGCVYTEQVSLSSKGWLLSEIRDSKDFVIHCGADFVFDIMRSQKTQNATVGKDGEKYILPVAGTELLQKIDFSSDAVSNSNWVGQWNYSFFRLEHPTKVSSDAPFIMGRPIRLGHNRRRKRVVLRILLDGLCWREMIRSEYRYVPNIIKFFSKGIIFNSHFSVSEYTYTSLPTIETGMYPEHSQLFNLNACCELDAHYKTLSEKMTDIGYYCVNIMGGGDGIYNGCTRGYERLVTTPYDLPTHVGVERAIKHLEAFADCDQVLFIHAMDTHPWNNRQFQVPLQTQTKLSLPDRLTGGTAREKASVYLPHTPLYEHANHQGAANADRALGTLFRYIQEHYDEDEYLIQVYSDHGVPIYDESLYILSENQVGAALMMRGAGVPETGFSEELTSTLDIYPITAHLLGFETGEWIDGNLPAAFGGRERDHVISESVYPGQTYKLCVRTKEHAFQLESVEPMDEDGTVDMSNARMKILPRSQSAAPIDEALWNKFTEIAKTHTATFNNEGHIWPEMRDARPLWFKPEEE